MWSGVAGQGSAGGATGEGVARVRAATRRTISLKRGQPGREADVKIGIIGAGAVGAATVSNLIQPGGVNPEIVLIDRQAKKAVGLAEDFSYAAALDSLSTVRAGG